MTPSLPQSGLQLRSKVGRDGLELTLVDTPIPAPQPHEVLIEVRAAPINPSDLGLLFGPADLSTLEVSVNAAHPVTRARIPKKLMASLQARMDQSLPIGNEGAGLVIAAGGALEAQALLGRVVAGWGGGMFSQFRALPASQCLPLPDDVSAADGASCFVNPLTALCMVHTMQAEGHRALVHTAGASNLGQMLNRICLNDGVDLISIVRRPAQATLLKDQGARLVLDTSEADFKPALVEALAQTGATIAFDAVGGGELCTTILSSMEAAACRSGSHFSTYGSAVHKQVYIYGGLDTRPTLLTRDFGMSWGIGGFLLPIVMTRLEASVLQAMQARVAAEIKTTFASTYAAEISLAAAIQPAVIDAYIRAATGRKYLIRPNA